MLPTLGFIGAGKVGVALAGLWQRAGYPIGGVASRTHAHALLLANTVGAEAMLNPQQVVAACEVIFVTVPDDAIAATVASLVPADWTGKLVVHTSGALDLHVMAGLVERGAAVASLHPAFPFTAAPPVADMLAGTTFAIEAPQTAIHDLLAAMVTALDGVTLTIPVGQKSLYHAALCICSNYTVTLYGVAQRLLLDMGASRSSTDQALRSLLTATLHNLVTMEVASALTGPLVRSDLTTLHAHLAALPDAASRHLYTVLARATYPLLAARDVALDGIEEVLYERDVL